MSETYSCPNGHQWEDTWGDDLSLASGQVTCPTCGAKVTVQAPAAMVKTVEFSAPASAPVGTNLANAPTWPSPGAAATEKILVPGYEILGELGRGGMGVVYKARHKALKRLVALKMVLSGGHASDSSLARFRAEAEAVARLQHPNIVQIYEIGEHDDRPFFAMEFVEGGSLQGKTVGNPQPAHEAAAMLATLARGVHAAHEKGIIHRDLKPANVLISKDGQPKITDFGLAKQLDEAGSQLSQTGDIMGTPSYMAPEQAAGKVKELGPAADIYALGAVLYELLTGRPPFKSETAMDTLLQVLYADPVPPSHLRARTPRDLETVCMKCLQKEPTQRYPTALALADDLQRFLDDKPVQARPTSNFTRTVKWFRRHPGIAGMMAITVLAGISVVSVMAWYNIDLKALNEQLAVAIDEAKQKKKEADDERDIADRERDKARQAEKKALREQAIAEERRVLAEDRFQDAMNAVRAMLTEVGQNDLINTPMMESVRKRLLDKALEFQKSFLTKNSSDPAVQAQVGQAHQLVGDINTMLGKFTVAEEEYRAGIALLEPLTKKDPKEFSYKLDLAACYFQLGQLLQTQEQLSEAAAAYREAERLQEEVKDRTNRLEHRHQLARTYNDLARVLRKSGRLAEAQKKYEAALAMQDALVAESNRRPEFIEYRAGTRNDLAIVLRRLKKESEAADAYTHALEDMDGLVRQWPEVVAYRSKQAAFHNNRGNLLRDSKPDEALKSFNSSVKLWENIQANAPLVPAYRYELANALNSRGILLTAAPMSGSLAAEDFDRAEKLLRELVRDYPTVAAYHSALGATLDNRALLLTNQGVQKSDPNLVKEARKQLAGALPQHQEAVKINDRDPAYRDALRNHYVKAANLLLREKTETEPAGAAAAAEKLWELCRDDPAEIGLAALFLSRCMEAVQLKMGPDAVARQYGKRSLSLLRQAVALGYARGTDLQKHASFAAVRKGFPDEFEAIVKDVEKP